MLLFSSESDRTVSLFLTNKEDNKGEWGNIYSDFLSEKIV